MLREYGSVRLFEAEASEAGEWTICDEATHARITLPADPSIVDEMHRSGFCFGDRTIGVSIGLKRDMADSIGKTRMDVSFETGCDESIFEIARTSFYGDRRFYITPDGKDQATAEAILSEWIGDLGDTLVCRHKGDVIGFLSLTCTDEGNRFVHLAAVDERYRLTGAAVSLYATAMQAAKEAGAKKLEGRISSRNVSVMNLYASLGAKFGTPLDVFLKEL